jgi:very-short-patch-repair endonuclease
VPPNNDARVAQPNLRERILESLRARPDQKAIELAQSLGVERREVNRCLTYDLRGKVVQNSAYRWRLSSPQAVAGPTPARPVAPPTELGRLCRYYLECVGPDSDQGVSCFASSNFGDPDYAELPALPMSSPDWEWWNAPGVGRVLSRVRADSSNLVAWMGYPIRLREHQTPNWHGFFVDPVMLWAIVLPAGPGEPYRLADDLPTPNVSFLKSVAMGDPSAVVEEAARLDDELGLNSPIDERPEADEVIERLVSIRPDWDWREPINPEACSQGPPLSTMGQAGIYNRAVILPGRRSPFTRGLEAELEKLSDTDETVVDDTNLGRWLSRQLDVSTQTDNQPLIEVLPMNSEQRAAVRSALVATHTVVTGPPGTGKSQVVTNLLVNAAWRGMKVLFASKNNKAVDVVEARVNGLGNRPVLLRLGSGDYQAKLADYLVAMLSGNVSNDDQISYDEGLLRHRRLSDKLADLDRIQELTLKARNLVDRLEAEVEPFRAVFGLERFNAFDEGLLSDGELAFDRFLVAVDSLDPSKQSFFGRLALLLHRRSRVVSLRTSVGELEPLEAHIGLPPLQVTETPDVSALRNWGGVLADQLKAAKQVAAYQSALGALRDSRSFEDIAHQRRGLTGEIAENSGRLWRDWVQLAPSRLTVDQRKDLADYTALLRVITGAGGENINATVRNKARALQKKVSKLFSCWAVTSLSARGKLPFEPGHFDLVVIDEASQCDIASALPLLFRAKRSVIIGDPMQLRHISALPRSKDADLQSKYGLVETRAAWMYSVNSLYDLAAGLADSSQIISLRDHHRSHADIIGFSNSKFYGDKLRVATRYDRLKRPRGQVAGVIWQDVKGRTTRPGQSGAQNQIEAAALVAALNDLLITRQYEGSVGVVTPFRGQKQLIDKIIAQSPAIEAVRLKRELLVDTVHRFQGDERDVMFFSPVVSEGITPGALAFLRSNGNLFNVAITRARGLLHVVGDRSAALACGVDYLGEFAGYIQRLSQHQVGLRTDEPTGGRDYPVVSNPERVSDWERSFYSNLYDSGIRPIPQFSVEQYDLDFAVIVGDRRLNIEVDGERYHRSWTGELCLRDQLRNLRLIELGWDVKRFWVYEIRDRLPDCIKQVQDWVESARAAGQAM